MANHRQLIRDRLARAMTYPGEAFVGFIDTAQDVFRELSNADAETVVLAPTFWKTVGRPSKRWPFLPRVLIRLQFRTKNRSGSCHGASYHAAMHHTILQCIIPCRNASCNDKRERP